MYQVKELQGGKTEIILYDLDFGGITAGELIRRLKDSTGEITLRINSEGGDVFDALAVYNSLSTMGREIEVRIDGIAASSASIIAMSGTRILMPRNAMIMLHNPSSAVSGTSEDLRYLADVMDKVRDSIAGIYAGRTGLALDKVKSLMDGNTWLSGEEAYSLGFCTELLDSIKIENNAGSYIDGITFERERLKSLDELYTPERAEIINQAKYETFEDAPTTALKILRASNGVMQSRIKDRAELGGITLGMMPESDAATRIAQAINQQRGYK